MSHEHLPAVEGGGNPCFNCPPILKQARPEKPICVGFGDARLTKNGETVLDGEEMLRNDIEPPTFADAEAMAVKDPDADWHVILHGPLHGETYQRQGEGVWILVERNEGFA